MEREYYSRHAFNSFMDTQLNLHSLILYECSSVSRSDKVPENALS